MSKLHFDSKQLIDSLEGTRLAKFSDALASAVLGQGHALKHGHLPGWEKALSQLPSCADAIGSVVDGVVTISGSFSDEQQAALHQGLTGLMPWRKGPFQIGPVFLDTEWRSDWKWDRLAAHISSLENRLVLDVGCGNGYHLWRMRHAGASQVIGIDPSLLYLKQFQALHHYWPDPALQLLPLPMEAMPANMGAFDTVFSMGVLYHRRNPYEHLEQLKQALCSGGELIIETLVVPGTEGDDVGLQIEGRYANMRNIYELPSLARLERWVDEAGFTQVQTVSVDVTSIREQRSTSWMPSYSLAQALDTQDDRLTVEGHPRPHRAIVIAKKPV